MTVIAMSDKELDRMQVLSDAPIPVVKDVAYSWTFGFAQLDIARNGTLVYRRSAARGELAGVSVDSSGATETVMASPAEYAFPSLSPDGRRIAVARVENGAPSLWIFDRVRKHIDRVSALPDSYGPTWTRDGRMLIVGGLSGMRWLTPDGAHSGPLTNSNAAQVPWSLSADGSRLAYHETSPMTGFDIWTVPVRENADGLTAGTRANGDDEAWLRHRVPRETNGVPHRARERSRQYESIGMAW